MLEEIMNCKKCNMCNNQMPLLDKINESAIDVMWVGLSAKEVVSVEVDIPLSTSTKSGVLISKIESRVNECKYYKTNVVKCLPLNEKGKLRYPTKKEMNLCITNLFKEIEILQPKVIILLGNNVIQSVEDNLQISFDAFDGYNYRLYNKGELKIMPIHHPSYISVYKKKFTETYIKAVEELIMAAI